MARRTGSNGSSQGDLFQQGGSTGAASPPSSPPTSSGSGNTTFSPASEGGPLPSSLLAHLPTFASGQAPAPVSLSRRRAGAWVPTIHGICGPTSFASSTPAGPLASWENRLRERLAMVGSTESALIWEEAATPAGHSISRLRPWTPLKSGSGSIGPPSSPWPAVQASAAAAGHASRSGDRKDELLLQGMMRVNTPQASPWATPRASDGEKGSTNQRFTAGGEPLPAQMGQTQQARPRAAPRAGDWRSGSSQVGPDELRAGGAMLPEQMTETASWPAPEAGAFGAADTGKLKARPARLAKKHGNNGFGLTTGHTMALTGEMAAGGPVPIGSPATTARPAGSPTPLHPCWLQGFPAVWLLGAASVTPSSRRSRVRR